MNDEVQSLRHPWVLGPLAHRWHADVCVCVRRGSLDSTRPWSEDSRGTKGCGWGYPSAAQALCCKGMIQTFPPVRSGFPSKLHHLLARCMTPGLFTLLRLSVPVCTMGTMTRSASQGGA